jgi:hypothetical protein
MIHLVILFIAAVAGLAAAVLSVIVLTKFVFSSKNEAGTLIGLVPANIP